MTGDEYQSLAQRTMQLDRDSKDICLHALHGLASEVGEIHGIYQKIYQGHEFDREHLFSEIGDLLWFIAELVTVNSGFLDDVMAGNIEKLRKRYPNGFETDRSVHRSENDI